MIIVENNERDVFEQKYFFIIDVHPTVTKSFLSRVLANYFVMLAAFSTPLFKYW